MRLVAYDKIAVAESAASSGTLRFAVMIDPQAFFEALADPIRRRILAMLLEHDELCVCDLHGALDAPQPKVSRHLAVLRSAALVRVRRDGVWMRYRLDPQLPAWALRILMHMQDGLGAEAIAPAPSVCAPGES